MDHLIEFALTRDEWQNVNTATAYRALRRAARTVYLTDKYQNRGEVGELLLHAVMRHHYGTEPIVSKFYFKSAANDTVKGFDAAHVVFVNPPEDLELWLGEAKLYIDVDAAIRDVCGELSTHLSGFIQLTYHNQGVDCGSHCERDNGSEDFDIEITMDMISAGVKAIDNHDPDREDKEALVFAILYRGFAIAKRNANARLSHS
jgi:hypothetical protein